MGRDTSHVCYTPVSSRCPTSEESEQEERCVICPRPQATKRPLKIGLFFQHAQVGPEGRKPEWEKIFALAKRAEEVGFDSLWFPDHFSFPRGDWG